MIDLRLLKNIGKKAYESGAIIISDRYTTSNMIHQGIKMERQDREAYLDWLTTLEFEHFGLPKPDLTIFLNELNL